MQMIVNAVIIYLPIILAGCVADSFAPKEIATRLRVSNAKGIFTQYFISGGGRKIPLYSALQIYRANSNSKVPKISKSNKVSWSKIRCPRQINSIGCGYFVMRFMKDVIMENEIMIPINYFPDHKCCTNSKDKLTDVKEDWASYMVDDIFGKQEAIILPS